VTDEPQADPTPQAEPVPGGTLSDEQRVARERGYVRLLLLAAGVGIPVSLVAFGFLALLHWSEHAVWEHLPETFGFAVAPWWWALPWLLLGGVLVGVAIRWLPGHGGHVPIDAHGWCPASCSPRSAACPSVPCSGRRRRCSPSAPRSR
jgi:hypothetical protein